MVFYENFDSSESKYNAKKTHNNNNNKPYTPNWYKEVNGPEQEDWKLNICRVITYKVWPRNHFCVLRVSLKGPSFPYRSSSAVPSACETWEQPNHSEFGEHKLTS